MSSNNLVSLYLVGDLQVCSGCIEESVAEFPPHQPAHFRHFPPKTPKEAHPQAQLLVHPPTATVTATSQFPTPRVQVLRFSRTSSPSPCHSSLPLARFFSHSSPTPSPGTGPFPSGLHHPLALLDPEDLSLIGNPHRRPQPSPAPPTRSCASFSLAPSFHLDAAYPSIRLKPINDL